MNLPKTYTIKMEDKAAFINKAEKIKTKSKIAANNKYFVPNRNKILAPSQRQNKEAKILSLAV